MQRVIKYYLLLLIVCSSSFATTESSIAEAPWQEGQVVAHGEDMQYKVYRKFIKNTPEGYLVQEFFSSQQPATNPFLLINEADITRYPKYYYDDSEDKEILLIQGSYERWHPTGQQERKGQYDRQGKRTGLWVSWYRNGQKRTQGHYLNGKFHGIWKHWNPEGEKLMDSYFNDGEPEINLATNYINIKGAKKQEIGEGTIWREFHKNAQIMSRGLFKQGKREGLWFYWDENGQKEAAGHYRDGKRNGTWTTFWVGQGSKEDQKKTEGEYLDGRRIGTWTIWDEKGNKTTEFYGDNSNDQS